MVQTVTVGIGVLLLYLPNPDEPDVKVVLGRRKTPFGFGTLSLPGGKLEFGESFIECGMREVEEEVGLVISQDRFYPGTVTYAQNDVIDGKHVVTLIRGGRNSTMLKPRIS
jgi:ADP-ribose pyrophosphatase YjhB (NUDIX family)